METGKLITVDSEEGKEFGFTSDKWQDCSYMFNDGDYITISFLLKAVERKGVFSELAKAITDKGYGILGPSPLPEMEEIFIAKGFRRVWVVDEDAPRRELIEAYLLPKGEKYGERTDI